MGTGSDRRVVPRRCRAAGSRARLPALVHGRRVPPAGRQRLRAASRFRALRFRGARRVSPGSWGRAVRRRARGTCLRGRGALPRGIRADGPAAPGAVVRPIRRRFPWCSQSMGLRPYGRWAVGGCRRCRGALSLGSCLGGVTGEPGRLPGVDACAHRRGNRGIRPADARPGRRAHDRWKPLVPDLERPHPTALDGRLGRDARFPSVVRRDLVLSQRAGGRLRNRQAVQSGRLRVLPLGCRRRLRAAREPCGPIWLLGRADRDGSLLQTRTPPGGRSPQR